MQGLLRVRPANERPLPNQGGVKQARIFYIETCSLGSHLGSEIPLDMPLLVKMSSLGCSFVHFSCTVLRLVKPLSPQNRLLAKGSKGSLAGPAAPVSHRAFSTKRGLTHLLVDADNQSIEQIKTAAHIFAGQRLRVSVFANPDRSTNKKCDGVALKPVPRVGGTADLADEAIKSFAGKLAKKQQVHCFAVLASDSGYVDLVRRLKSSGKKVVIILPRMKSAAARIAYEAEKMPKLSFWSQHGSLPQLSKRFWMPMVLGMFASQREAQLRLSMKRTLCRQSIS